MTAIDAIEELKKVDTLDMPARLCEAHYMAIEVLKQLDETLNMANKVSKQYGVLQEIRREIEKPLRDERCYDTADAKAQYIALNWVCEIIDKHIKEIEGSDTE